jgi:hypothetical protein
MKKMDSSKRKRLKKYTKNQGSNDRTSVSAYLLLFGNLSYMWWEFVGGYLG